jgi:spoIIIJ-associated protein
MDQEYREFEAKNVDDAVILAMKTLHADFDDLEIKVVSEGSKGLFGIIGNKPAKILVRNEKAVAKPDRIIAEEINSTPAPSAKSKPEPRSESQEPTPEMLQEAQGIVTDLLKLLNMPGEVKIREEGLLEIMGDGSGLIIGKRGQTLDSLQFILNRIVNKSRSEPVFITLDTEGYRQRHVNYLKSMAKRMGQKARRSGQAISLEKMNPYDRRIIHLALKNENGLNTKSIGEGIYKKVIIVPRKASRR